MAELLFGAGNSVTFGTTGDSVSTTGSYNKSALSNLAIGDVLVAYIHNQNGSAAPAITPPHAGWVQVGPAPGNPTVARSRRGAFYYYKIPDQAALDALASVQTWTFDSAGRVTCEVARGTGLDLDTLEDSASASWSPNGSGTSHTIPGITTVAEHTLLIGAVFHHTSANGPSPGVTGFMGSFLAHNTVTPGPAPQVGNSGSALGFEELLVPGFTGDRTATFDQSASVTGGALIALRAGTFVPPDPAGKPVHYTSAPDTLAVGELFYTSAPDTLAVPAEVRPFPEGYADVATMLAMPTFYVAHRGGGRDHPEMSLYAYTQAGFWGVGALSISLARTSDGVWFGLHDGTLDRTSGTVGFVASEHTWAEVQTYSIDSALTVDPSQPDRPYMRWEEIAAAYYPSHVMLVDLKLAAGHAAEFLDMLDTLPGDPTARIMGKIYGPSTEQVPPWTNRGYSMWGFFYGDGSMDNIAADQASYAALGMDWNAAQSYWDTITGFGKPVIGHVIETPAQRDTALAKGADGLQVSRPKVVIPRST